MLTVFFCHLLFWPKFCLFVLHDLTQWRGEKGVEISSSVAVYLWVWHWHQKSFAACEGFLHSETKKLFSIELWGCLYKGSITQTRGFCRAVTCFISSLLHSLPFQVQPLISSVFIPLRVNAVVTGTLRCLGFPQGTASGGHSSSQGFWRKRRTIPGSRIFSVSGTVDLGW